MAITGKQKAARRKNIAIARAAKKSKGGSKKKKWFKSTEAAEYLKNRSYGFSKSKSRSMAIKTAKAQYRRLKGR